MVFNSLSKQPDKMMLYIKSAELIKEYIRNNELHSGDKLPGERTLSEILKISRNSVREGLRLLETQGVISTKSGIGSFVNQQAESDSLVFQLFTRNFTEILEIRTLLERYVLTVIPTELTTEQKQQLQDLSQEMKSMLAQNIYPKTPDWELHRMLVQLQPNKIIQEVSYELMEVLDEYWSQTNPDFDALNRTIPYHIQMIDCLCNGDKQGALVNYEAIYDIDIEAMTKKGR